MGFIPITVQNDLSKGGRANFRAVDQIRKILRTSYVQVHSECISCPSSTHFMTVVPVELFLCGLSEDAFMSMLKERQNCISDDILYVLQPIMHFDGASG